MCTGKVRLSRDRDGTERILQESYDPKPACRNCTRLRANLYPSWVFIFLFLSNNLLEIKIAAAFHGIFTIWKKNIKHW